MVVMRHPHIIKLREAFLTQDHLAIVMEVHNARVMLPRRWSMDSLGP